MNEEIIFFSVKDSLNINKDNIPKLVNDDFQMEIM